MGQRDDAAWDFVSKFVLRRLRFFADLLSMFVACVFGWGGILTSWVMVDAGHLAWRSALVLTVVCLVIAWFSEALRRRHLRRVQISPYPRSREPV